MLCREDTAAVDMNAELLVYGTWESDSLNIKDSQVMQSNDGQKLRLSQKKEALKKVSAEYRRTPVEIEAVKAEKSEQTGKQHFE